MSAAPRYAPSPPGATPGAEPLDAIVAAARKAEVARKAWKIVLPDEAEGWEPGAVARAGKPKSRPSASQRFKFINPATRIK